MHFVSYRSRTLNEIVNFSAPLRVYDHLYHEEIERYIAMRSVPHDEDRTVLICVGKNGIVTQQVFSCRATLDWHSLKFGFK